jgi:hypothetical protein
VGTKKASRLLQRAKESPGGWTRNELDSLYKSYGFIITNRTKHDIAKHPDLPKTEKATLTRSTHEIHPDYIRRAVELIEMLLVKEGEKDG